MATLTLDSVVVFGYSETVNATFRVDDLPVQIVIDAARVHTIKKILFDAFVEQQDKLAQAVASATPPALPAPDVMEAEFDDIAF